MPIAIFATFATIARKIIYMDSLSGILNQKKSASPVLRGAAAALTVEEADRILDEIFGSEVKRFARASHVKNGVLSVKTTGSSSATEIKLHEAEILAKITQKFGHGCVNKIRCI